MGEAATVSRRWMILLESGTSPLGICQTTELDRVRSASVLCPVETEVAGVGWPDSSAPICSQSVCIQIADALAETFTGP